MAPPFQSIQNFKGNILFRILIFAPQRALRPQSTPPETEIVLKALCGQIEVLSNEGGNGKDRIGVVNKIKEANLSQCSFGNLSMDGVNE